MNRSGVRRAAGLAGCSLVLAAFAEMAAAGTTGRLAGRILDTAKQPLVGVNIAIPAARLGALSAADGSYSILNVPAGTYKLKAWHERLPAVTREITVAEKGEVNVDFTLGIAGLPQY